MAMHFDLVDLRLMVRIAETNGLTRGAEASHMSLPAASTSLAARDLTPSRGGPPPHPVGKRPRAHAMTSQSHSSGAVTSTTSASPSYRQDTSMRP